MRHGQYTCRWRTDCTLAIEIEYQLDIDFRYWIRSVERACSLDVDCRDRVLSGHDL